MAKKTDSGFKKLKILFASSEVQPFSQTGGLGDVSGALPKYLKKLGHDVIVVTPRYYGVDRTLHKLTPENHALGIPVGHGENWAQLYHGYLGKGKYKVPVYFLEFERYYGRDGLYNDSHGEGFADNLERFTMLSRGALQTAKYLNFSPDIIHANDWQTALIPIYLNTWEKNTPLGNAASILTLHNLAHQGNFDKNELFHTQLGWEHFHHLCLEHADRLNILKGGIYHATKLNAVSPTYAREIQTPAEGYGLDGALRDRTHDLTGILNGIDYQEWNPESDTLIPANFSIQDLSGKAICKAALQKAFNLPVRADVPVFGLVSRLAWQKGIDILAAAIHRILNLDIQLVILGMGEVWSHFYFGDLPKEYPSKIGVHIGFNKAMSHIIEAGSDFFLMPSRFEPCGLNQMYSQRYGTLPIVRSTGGLADTVTNFTESREASQEKGTGFVFHNMDADSLFDTVGWANYTYYNKKAHIQQMIHNAMSTDFSWERAAQQYSDFYLDAIKSRGRSNI